MRTTLGPILVALALVSGCGGERRAEPVAAAESSVYRLTAEELPDGGCDDPSCTIIRFVVWVAPEPGWSRSETEDGTGFQTTTLFAHGSLMTDHNDGPPAIRSGLASFVGDSPHGELVDAIRARGTLAEDDRIRVDYDGRTSVVFVVQERLDLEGAAARALFALPDDGIRSRTVEPGTPSDLLRAYWLGDRYGDLDAVTAVERDAAGTESYAVFYGEGPMSAGALQIANAAVDSAEGREALTRLAGKRRTIVRLADGERAQLIEISRSDGSYLVATRTTVVGFVARSEAEAIRLAETLRPVEGR